MTKHTNTTQTNVNLQSGEQNMFGDGAARVISYEDYVPIIGGEISDVTAQNATASIGRATVDGARVEWDDQGLFENLRPGQTNTVVVQWDMVDGQGSVIETRQLKVEARGTAEGPVFINTETREMSTSGLSFVGVFGEDLLQNVQEFDRVELASFGFDLDDVFDTELGGLAELAALAAKVGGLEIGAKSARGLANGAKALADEIDALDPEGHISDFLQDGVSGGIDFLQNVIGAFEDAFNVAIDGLRDVGVAVFEFFGGEVPPTPEEVIADFLLLQQAPESARETYDTIMESIFGVITGGFGSLLDLDIPTFDDFVASKEAAYRDALREVKEGGSQKVVDFANAQLALSELEGDINDAIELVETKTREFRELVQDKTVGGLDRLADIAEAELRESRVEMNAKLKELQGIGLLEDVASGAADISKALGSLGLGVIKEIDQATFNLLDKVDVRAELEVGAETFAQAGLLIDFEMGAGKIESDLDYDLTSTAVYDDVTDVFTVTALAESATTGEAVAFETVSPNLEFFAGIAYHAGATLDFLGEMFAKVGGKEFFSFKTPSFTHDVVVDGVMTILDFDSTEAESIDIPLPDKIGDILGVSVGFPTIETKGKAAEISADPYSDPEGLFDMDALSDLLVDLTEMKLDYSPEFKALLAKRGAEVDLQDSDFAAAIKQALGALTDSVLGEGDTDGDGVVPVLMVKTGEKGVDALIHIDTIETDVSALDLENNGTFGFFVSEGVSGNIFEVSVDVDQLVATAVNIALGNGSGEVLNPLDLTIGIGELLEIAKVDKGVIKQVEDFLTFTVNVEAADLDVRAGANFSQEFALSVDDIDFSLAFEDGTMHRASASEGGEIVVENASSLVDTNGNGQIDYRLELTPDATLFNDTEFGLNVGYTMDLLKGHIDTAVSLSLDTLFPGADLGSLSAFEETFNFGPLLRLEGDLDLVSADVFESLFDFHAGSAGVEGAFDLAKDGADIEDPFITVSELPPELPVGQEVPVVLADGPILGSREADVLLGTDGQDKIRAKGGDDMVQAGAGRDKVKAGGGSDLVFGEAGRDKLVGGKGDDFMSGGDGADRMIGGKGNDFLQGDAGADVFHFAKGHGVDNVADFEVGVDTISIGRGANRLNQLEIEQEGGSAVISFADVEISLDSVNVELLLAADSFSF